MVHNTDISELRRMATNLYDGEKALFNRVIKGIADLTAENSKLKAELQKLKEKS